jgi:hypothetical protein
MEYRVHQMEETFAHRLWRFSLAVDIVDRALWDEVWSLIIEYLRKSLGPKYFAVLTPGYVANEPGLHSMVCSAAPVLPAFRIRRSESDYDGLAGYSFDRWKHLWVVAAENQGPLGPGVGRRDLWANAQELPEFDRPTDEGIHTVVMVPVGTPERKVGLLDLQLLDYHEVTEQVKTELGYLAKTLAVLIPLCHEYDERREHTREAIGLHRIALNNAQWPPLTKPQLFLSSSADAAPEVMAVIMKVLEGFRDRVRVHDWQEAAGGGNINTEMLRQIQASQYGICCLSESAGEGNGRPYRDNPNVLFEAGMMQALSMEETPRAWLPIRERDSPDAPFNLAQQRMVIIDRNENGDLMKAKLHSDLQAQLNAILQS